MSDSENKFKNENDYPNYKSMIDLEEFSLEDYLSQIKSSPSYLFQEELELQIPNIIGFNNNMYFIDGNPNNPLISEQKSENKDKSKNVEAILISSKEEDKEKNSTKEDEKKESKKTNFLCTKKTKRTIEYKEKVYEYEYEYFYNYKANPYTHSKFSNDNITKKIIAHFFKFLIQFLNVILEEYKYEEKFLSLKKDDKEVSNASKENVNKLKNKTIKEIFSFEICKKYKIHKTDNKANEKIYKKVLTEFPLLDNLFEQKFVDIFNEIYCNKNKKVIKGIIDLNIYNINLKIDLKKNKLKTYEDLKKKVKRKIKSSKEYNEYIKKMEAIVNKIIAEYPLLSKSKGQ